MTIQCDWILSQSWHFGNDILISLTRRSSPTFAPTVFWWFQGEQKFNPLKSQCCPHLETSQLICCANHFAGFYVRAALAFNGLNNDNLETIRKLNTLMTYFTIKMIETRKSTFNIHDILFFYRATKAVHPCQTHRRHLYF